ncbi:MAG: heavy-metal-associated domain-containing protein, partial [Acidimicrobiia bacterium]|nr:heavy-metal-associated domain-containing protein [Acidimicrobiia bacterium]
MIPAVLDWLRSRGRHTRRVSRGPGRVHVEVRSLHEPSAGDLAQDLKAALEALGHVDWVQVNQAIGRVLVAFDDEAIDAGDIVDIVEAVEDAHGAAKDLFPHDRPDFPGDAEPLLRDTVALAADVVAVGLGAAGRFARMTAVPIEAVAAIPFIQSQARVRELLERVVGAPLTDAGLAVANAVAQALAQGPLGPAVDGLERTALLAEHSARRALWRVVADDIC